MSDTHEAPRSGQEWLSILVQEGWPAKIAKQGIMASHPGQEANARKVMQSLMDGNGIPANERGIWTVADDLGLRRWETVSRDQSATVEARREAMMEGARLRKKHGSWRMRGRQEYLGWMDLLGMPLGSHDDPDARQRLLGQSLQS